MPVLKRPAAKSQAEPKMKRPAAAGIKDVVSELNEEANNPEDQEGESGEIELRDKQKSQKFHKLRANGGLPDHIVHMYEVQSKAAPEGQRNFITKLINGLFKKQADGTFKVLTDKHEFKEYKKVYNKHLAEDKVEALPRLMMLASKFHGNETLMEKAISKGELVSRIDEKTGVEYLQFRKLSETNLKGNEEGETVDGSKKLSRDEAHSMANVMAKLKWKFELSKVGFNCSELQYFLQNIFSNLEL